MVRINLFVLSALSSLVFGKIEVHPDDPYAYLAINASSYSEWAQLIIASTTTNDASPAPSPIVSVSKQQQIADLVFGPAPSQSSTTTRVEFPLPSIKLTDLPKRTPKPSRISPAGWLWHKYLLLRTFLYFI
jgi:hypothetical protein